MYMTIIHINILNIKMIKYLLLNIPNIVEIYKLVKT